MHESCLEWTKEIMSLQVLEKIVETMMVDRIMIY